jgi:hypothetical protein
VLEVELDHLVSYIFIVVIIAVSFGHTLVMLELMEQLMLRYDMFIHEDKTYIGINQVGYEQGTIIEINSLWLYSYKRIYNV